MITNGQELREARNRLGMSLTELAKELRLGRSGAHYLRDIESDNGRAKLSGPLAVAVECLLTKAGLS